MSKLLVYAGLGFGVILLAGLVVMLVLQQPTTGPADHRKPAAASPESRSSAGAAADADDSAAPRAESSGLDTQTRKQLEGLGFRVFGDPPQAEDFVLQTIDQGELRLSSFEGKVVLMNFWATWCPPCVEEMPSMQRLYESLPRESFEILAINMQEDRDTVQQFISQHNFEYPILLDVEGGVAQRYAVRGLPTSYVIAPDGSMPAALIGFAHWDEPEFVEFFRGIAVGARTSR